MPAPQVFDDVLTIWVRCAEIRGARFRYEYVVERDGRRSRRAQRRMRPSTRPRTARRVSPLVRRDRPQGRVEDADAGKLRRHDRRLALGLADLFGFGSGFGRVLVQADDGRLADVVPAPGRVVHERAIRGVAPRHARRARRRAELLDDLLAAEHLRVVDPLPGHLAFDAQWRRLRLDATALRSPARLTVSEQAPTKARERATMSVSFVNTRSRSG